MRETDLMEVTDIMLVSNHFNVIFPNCQWSCVERLRIVLTTTVNRVETEPNLRFILKT